MKGKSAYFSPENCPHAQIETKLFLHQKGTPEKAGKLVIIILGQSQHLGKNTAGLYFNERADYSKEGYEVLTFRVGDLYSLIGNDTNLLPLFKLSPEVVLAHIENVIQDRMHNRGMFQGLPQITEIAGKGYSWGGGALDRIFSSEDNIRDICAGVTPTALSYVDAIQYGGGNAVNKRPICDHFFNYYQTNPGSWPSDVIPVTDGDPIIIYNPNPFTGDTLHGTSIPGANTELDLWDAGINVTHGSIDEWASENDNDQVDEFDILHYFTNTP